MRTGQIPSAVPCECGGYAMFQFSAQGHDEIICSGCPKSFGNRGFENQQDLIEKWNDSNRPIESEPVVKEDMTIEQNQKMCVGES